MLRNSSRSEQQPALVTRLRLLTDIDDIVVPTAEIDYLEGATGRLRIYHGDRTYVAEGKLSDLAARLGPRFIRVNRSTVVNGDRVNCCTVLPDGDLALHLSGDRRLHVDARFGALFSPPPG